MKLKVRPPLRFSSCPSRVNILCVAHQCDTESPLFKSTHSGAACGSKHALAANFSPTWSAV